LYDTIVKVHLLYQTLNQQVCVLYASKSNQQNPSTKQNIM